MSSKAQGRPASLASRIRNARLRADMTLDELADAAGISKTYLWELEQDTTGHKRPSAAILSRLADALSVSLPDLLDLPSIKGANGGPSIALPSSLARFAARMKLIGQPLSAADLRDLAAMRFRGGQPATADGWHALYLALAPKGKE